MKHYVLLKFKPNFYNEEVLQYTKDVFNKISKLDNINNVKVHSNCIARDSNMDIMIEMDLKDEDTLKYYLQHELHLDFVKTIDEHVELRVSFDC